ncbi:response regulator [Dyadobacter fermentans]|uniref:Response regulator receiver protein n=1 Tax=Dyadobacter fermentans (strain ATCC 700827 / DSM 18053 / CIP 107007 / KCTC 52180 / NS114) TaxID=471854 RepID=C6VUS8_DYAFD|nr:response regulator [Dyadobacter fermentans]ACT93065.1 response regulator receiver protein [Dyadobacter fermentans DSM 18053]
MGNNTLLVVIDDDTDDQEIFKMAVEDLDEPIDCLYFTDCESAIAHFSQPQATTPSWIFIDLKLPRVDGEQCLAQLQQLRQFDHPFMVVFSSSIPDNLREKLSNSGVDKVIPKTSSIPELANQIQQVVKMH